MPYKKDIQYTLSDSAGRKHTATKEVTQYTKDDLVNIELHALNAINRGVEKDTIDTLRKEITAEIRKEERIIVQDWYKAVELHGSVDGVKELLMIDDGTMVIDTPEDEEAKAS